MSWKADKVRWLEWVAMGLLAIVMSVFAYMYTGLADEVTTDAADRALLHKQADRAEGRAEVNDQLLKEVRDDVKKLLERVPERK